MGLFAGGTGPGLRRRVHADSPLPGLPCRLGAWNSSDARLRCAVAFRATRICVDLRTRLPMTFPLCRLPPCIQVAQQGVSVGIMGRRFYLQLFSRRRQLVLQQGRYRQARRRQLFRQQ